MIASLLNVSDPSGDAVGAGELAAPKAAIFRDLSNFDVLNLSIADQNTFAFEISMASLENPWDLPLGFSLPIIEVYALIDPVKRNDAVNELLPGSEMSIGKGKKWNYAFRITGNAIDAFTVRDGVLRAIDQEIDLSYSITDNRIYIETNIRLVGDLGVYTMSGSYDPFSETGWRGVAKDSSSWMLSSKTPTSPVMDVVVDDFSMQQRSIQSGVLPEITASARQPFWLWIVVAGLLTCLLALILRPRKKIQDKLTVSSEVEQKASVPEPISEPISEASSESGFEATSKSVDLESQVVGFQEDIHDHAQPVDLLEEARAFQPAQAKSNSPKVTESETQALKKTRPIQWTSWDEGEFASEDTLDTMIEFDRIANEEVQQKEVHLNVERLDSETESDALLDTPSAGMQPPKTQFEENLLPNVEDESLLSSKQPPKGFTKRMKTFGLDKADEEDTSES